MVLNLNAATVYLRSQGVTFATDQPLGAGAGMLLITLAGEDRHDQDDLVTIHRSSQSGDDHSSSQLRC